jgi:hypothetical protein
VKPVFIILSGWEEGGSIMPLTEKEKWEKGGILIQKAGIWLHAGRQV